MAVLDWQTITPIRDIGKVFGYVELPAFDVADLEWKGASEIVRRYDFTASKNFTIRERPQVPIDCNYCLVVSFRIGDNTYRYKLWEGVGERLNERLYRNDVIRPNFSLEIWSVLDATEATNADTITLPLSIQQLVTDFTEAPADFEEAVGEVVAYADLFNTNAPPATVSAPFLLGLEIWLNETGLVPGALATWNDQSGNGRNLTQATVGQRPVVDDDNAVVFENDNNIFIVSNFVLTDLYMVLQLDGVNVGDSIAENDYTRITLNPADGWVRSTFYAVTSDVQIPAAQLVVLRWTGYPTNPGVLRNRLRASMFGPVTSEDDNVTAQPSPVLAGTFFRLGKAINGGSSFKIREVLGYSLLLNDITATRILRYLSDKYSGAPIGVPLDFDGSVTPTNPPAVGSTTGNPILAVGGHPILPVP